jgi:predicted secreted protein
MHRSIGLGIVLLVLLSGCTSTGGSRAKAVPRAIAVTSSLNGSHVQLEVGQMLWVELPEHAAGNFTWQIASPLNQTVLRPEGRHFRAPDVGPDGGTDSDAGAGTTAVGTQQLRFKAMSEGEVLLDLALVRPGTGLGGAADRWIVQVVVR